MTELQARIQNLIESRRKLRDKFSTAPVIRPNEIMKSAEDQFMKKVLTSIESPPAGRCVRCECLGEEVSMSTVQLYRKLKSLAGPRLTTSSATCD